MLNLSNLHKTWRETRKPPVIVVGTGRCGTSLVAGILHKLGVYMGRLYIAPNKFNPTGYFEDLEIAKIDGAYIHSGDKEAWLDGMNKLLVERERHLHWGFKSLGTANIIDDLVPIIPAAKYIWCRRDISKSVESMTRLKDTPPAMIEQIMQKQDKHIQEHIPEGSLVLNYENLILTEPKQTVNEIIDFAELNPTKEQIARAEAHILQKPPEEGVRFVSANLV